MNTRFGKVVVTVVACIALLWAIELLDRALDLGLYRLGVYPGSPEALPGILLAPLIHGSWSHLGSNSFALLILGSVLLYGYPRSALPALLFIWLVSGAGVWLFARESYHFGASGLTHGMMFYIFVSGILRSDRLSIALSMIVFFLYGGMVWSIFPQEPGISYESHFFGAVAGIVAAFMFRNRDPLPPRKTYDWEGEDDDDMESASKDDMATHGDDVPR